MVLLQILEMEQQVPLQQLETVELEVLRDLLQPKKRKTMNPLRHQIQQLAQAPGVATNPFEKILAGFGIVRDDVRRAALQQHVYSNNRKTDLDFAAQNRDAALEHGKKLADSLPADVEAYESSPLGGVSMRRRHISSVPPKQPKNPTTAGTATPGKNPALQAPTRASVAGQPRKREATIKDVEAAVALNKSNPKLGIDAEQAANISKGYAAKQGRQAAGAAMKAQAKQTPARTPKSNVGPTIGAIKNSPSVKKKSGNPIDEVTGPVNPAGNPVGNPALNKANSQDFFGPKGGKN
jgi:hypothetical protein